MSSQEELLVSGYLVTEGLITHQSPHFESALICIIRIYYGTIAPPPQQIIYHPHSQQILYQYHPSVNSQAILHHPSVNSQSHGNGWTWDGAGKFVLKIGAKTAMKMTLNSVAPGASSVVDFIEAAHSFSNGDIIGGVISTGFGIWDFVTLGSGSALKETYNEWSSNAMKQVTKDAVYDATDDLVMDFGRDSLRNFGTDSLRDFGTDSLRDFGTDSLRNFGGDSLGNFGRSTFTNFGRDSLNQLGQDSLRESGSLFAREGSKAISNSVLIALVAVGVISAGQKVTKEGLRNALKEAKTPFVKQLIQQTLKDMGNKE